MDSIKDTIKKNKNTCVILLLLFIIGLLYYLLIVKKVELFNDDVSIIIQPSEKTKDLDIDLSKLSRIIYKTSSSHKVNFYPSTEQVQLEYGTGILNDYRPKSFISISHPNQENFNKNEDTKNKYPIVLRMQDLKMVKTRLDSLGNRVEFSTENVDKIDSVYIKFANDKVLPTKGDYKLVLALETPTKTYNPIYRLKFTLGENEDEVLIVLPKPIILNLKDKIYFGIKKINEDNVEIAEILFNMKENFDKVKKALLDKEKGKLDLFQERMEQIKQDELKLEEMKTKQ
jgi:hypothetical protein